MTWPRSTCSSRSASSRCEPTLYTSPVATAGYICACGDLMIDLAAFLVLTYLFAAVPFGLVVLRGIAELAGVPTPTIDKILLWAQNASGVRYLVRRTINLEDAEADFDQSEANTSNFTLRGEHVFRTRCPQRFGWFELNHFMVANGYVTSASTSNTEGTLFGSTRKTSATDITKSAGAA